MGRLSGFRPPQFSEEDTWLPCWLQQCSGEWLDVSMKEDHVTFEQRVEELLCPWTDIENGDSLRDEGGCNIGQLFISGTDSSPYSCAQSANNPIPEEQNQPRLRLRVQVPPFMSGIEVVKDGVACTVVQFHLCLSSDGDSEDSALSTDACDTDPNYSHVAQPRENLESLGQKDANLTTFLDAGAVNSIQTAELDRNVNKNELLKNDDNVNFSKAASDAVELCIAASEALVINEVIDCDSFEKYSSASAILEASLQLKQARLEVWKNTFADSLSVISDMDNLSDLDDMTMKSVYEDAGIHFSEFPGNELSVSQVKDTLESDHDDELEHKKAGASDIICDKSGNYNYGNAIQLRNDLPPEYCDSDAQKKVVCKPVCDLGTDVGHSNDCSRAVDAQANCCLSVSGSAEEVNTLTPENNPHESHVCSSPIMSSQDGEKDYCQPNMVQESFQSRWLGGWSNNNVLKCATKKCRIPDPFVGQTSFLSESADTAPDANSFMKNHDKQAIIASQLSVPSENFSNRANDGLLLSQDVGSSCASLLDPLCSFVPCSISENLCSSPAINYGDAVFPITNEYEKDNVLGPPSLHKMPAQGEEIIARRMTDNNDPGSEVSRRSTSLRDYSRLLPSHTKLFGKDSHEKSSFLIERNPKLTFQETNSSNREDAVKAGDEQQVLHKEISAHTLSPEVNHRTSICSKHNFAEENPIGTAQPESIVKHLPCETLQPQSAQKLPARKRVHFSERETDILENNKIRKLQTASKPGYFTRAAKRLTRFSDLESRAQQMDKFLRVNLDKKKKRLIFQNMEFLLTGLSQQKEKEIEGLIRKYGGIVISQIPPTNSKGKRSSRSKSRVLPVVLCLKKTQSFKFLYGCAVNAYVLRVNWLIDSIAEGVVLQPKRYAILPRNISRNDQVYTPVKYNTHSLVFNNLGVMLHGKTKYLTNITTIFKHGGGQVFKTLQGLIQALETGRISTGIVVADEESCASRQLRHCAMEQSIPMTSVYWIIKCLYAGQLTPLEEKTNSWCSPAIKLQRHPEPMELSQEI
ncbi:hypothetical protein C2S51_002743 [Perilla frutescens var. frutescens]|nr:hypothetical protein C2S51_002743 [Perilla frutescens var. frutescens]